MIIWMFSPRTREGMRLHESDKVEAGFIYEVDFKFEPRFKFELKFNFGRSPPAREDDGSLMTVIKVNSTFSPRARGKLGKQMIFSAICSMAPSNTYAVIPYIELLLIVLFLPVKNWLYAVGRS